MTVWAVNKSNEHDVSGALQFGDIRYVNHRYVYGDEIDNERMPQDVIKTIWTAACEFRPDRDYILITGDHLQLLQFVKAVEYCTDGAEIRVLRYDKKAAGYIPVRLV
jgi:hypothetical protein